MAAARAPNRTLPCTADESPPVAWRRAALLGAAYYYVASSVVFVAVWIGVYVLPSNHAWRTYLGSFVYVDGTSHEELVSRGYGGDAKAATRFPSYIVLSWTVKQLAGASAAVALVLTANACFLAALVVLAKYLAVRRPGASGAAEPPGVGDLTLLALGLWPHSLFFRMAYTESLFLLCSIVSLYGMQRRWPAWAIALVVGLTTATRPVGVALVAVFALYLWQESRRAQARPLDAASKEPPQAATRVGWVRSLARFLPRAALWLPVACWGLIAFMAFSHYEFGDALAFAHAQNLWVGRPTALADKIVPLLTLEPLWSPFVPGSPLYWGNSHVTSNPLLLPGFVNPIAFVLTAALVIFGAAKRWLNARELLLSALLLGIPYVTMAYDNAMLGQARFASVVFPAFIVLARLLRRLPWWAVAIFFLGCASLLGVYSALYGGGYGQTYTVLY